MNSNEYRKGLIKAIDIIISEKLMPRDIKTLLIDKLDEEIRRSNREESK